MICPHCSQDMGFELLDDEVKVAQTHQSRVRLECKTCHLRVYAWWREAGKK
jgi:hypothetical protein